MTRQLSASRRLLVKLDLVVPGMMAHLQRLWAQPDQRAVYLSWLAATHCMIRSTVPLMLLATQRCLQAPDPLTQGLARYFAKHIREEFGHDEWVLEDYAAAGGDPAQVRDVNPSAGVAALVGAQYYWIEHRHPVALLGHIAVLEGNPPNPRLVDKLCASTGLPAEAFRTLERHASLDVRHRRELHEALDRLPLEPWHEALILSSALHTVHAICDVVDEVLGSAPSLVSVSRAA
ncbi:iron-containing redox enzyme family protein [Micromonospora sp. Llam7]|uniref:iron-containing redox enzyme family protein n=1 Tax=Micromonospora tarapacensis TaxID=2835305 RepID=UPI001C83C63A|nr:iron-containing redox enzyme family protein [Micromonospora tarapacensis]MBX7265712.1 iron-containing redox enzyme family protein [Micromonospora tarapacensis]